MAKLLKGEIRDVDPIEKEFSFPQRHHPTEGPGQSCFPTANGANPRHQLAGFDREGFLFTSTLADNLRYGEPEANTAQVESAATQARLADDIKGFPDGYETIVGERGITLSGGQRQRTALGRALLVDAPVLVLDDALASVDNNTAAAILDSIRAQDGRTIVMISHQLSAAAACDRILVMDNGQIVQQGHHNELIQTAGVYRRLWEREQAVEELDAMAS